MTIYWERCSICGRHYPTKTCWLHPELNVCPHCCLLCPERSICPNPVWFPNLRLEAVREEQPAPEAREARREERAAAVPTGAAGAAAQPRAVAAKKTGVSEERREKIKKLEELLRRLGGEA